MSDNEISINIKGPSELKLTITTSLDKTVQDLKQAIAEKSDVEADRQRLIYSGRVLKDDDLLSAYKIQSSHTIHMVKSHQAAASASTAPPQLPTMQAGQNPTDPLTLLNGPQGHGIMAGLNPFAGTGLNINDPNMMQGMMESPQFLEQMSNMMSNPAVVDQLIASDPNLAALGPQLRQMFQSPQFRQMISNPESLRHMLTMANSMRAAGFDPANPSAMAGLGGGGGFGGGFGGFGGFPGAPPAIGAPPAAAPGAGAGGAAAGGPTNLFNQAAQSGAGGAAGAGGPLNPFGGFAGLGGLGGLAGLGGPASPGAAGAPGAGAGAGAGAGGNPFGAIDPALMAQILGGQGGFGGFGGFGGAGAGAPAAPAAPVDTRSVEERFQTQLQQLNEMGFNNPSQNIRALLATGGNVQAAINYIFEGGGL